jgi:hypothetical protein
MRNGALTLAASCAAYTVACSDDLEPLVARTMTGFLIGAAGRLGQSRSTSRG